MADFDILFVSEITSTMNREESIPDELQGYILTDSVKEALVFYQDHRSHFSLLKIMTVIAFCLSKEANSEITKYFISKLVRKKFRHQEEYLRVVRKNKTINDKIVYYLVFSGDFVNLSNLFGYGIGAAMWEMIQPYGEPIIPILHMIAEGNNELFQKMLNTFTKACIGSVENVTVIVDAIFLEPSEHTKSKQQMLASVLQRVFEKVTEIKHVKVTIYRKNRETDQLQRVRYTILGEKHGAIHSALLKVRWANEAKFYRELLMLFGKFDVTEILKDFVCAGHRYQTTIENLLEQHDVDHHRQFQELTSTSEKCGLINIFAGNEGMHSYLYILYVYKMIDTNVQPDLLCRTILETNMYQVCPNLNRNIKLLYVAGETFELNEVCTHYCHKDRFDEDNAGVLFKTPDDVICPYAGIDETEECFVGKPCSEFGISYGLREIARKSIRDRIREVDPHANMFRAVAYLNRCHSIPEETCKFLLYNYLSSAEFQDLGEKWDDKYGW